MSVQTEIDRIEQNIANTYAVLSALGAEMPSEQNSDNLAETAGTTKAVLYTLQTLTEAEKTQARENIGAASQESIDTLSSEKADKNLPPDYWISAVDAIEAEVKAKQHLGGKKSFQFAWFSDVTGADTYPNSNGAGTSDVQHIGKLTQYVIEKFNLPLSADAGDIMSQATHATEARVWNEYKALDAIFASIEPEKRLAVKGNHDGAWGEAYNGVSYLKYIGTNKIFDAIYRKQATDRQRVFGDDGTYFYVDYPQKVRFIMLNSQTDGDGSVDENGHAVYSPFWNSVYGQAQLEWFANALLTMPEGWSAIVMSHAQLALSKDGALVAGIIDAYNSRSSYNRSITISADYWGTGVSDNSFKVISVDVDFTDAVGEVIAHFHGHVHKDIIDLTTYSFPEISITCAGGNVKDTDPVERVPGTATELAMDIVTVDMENKNIYCTRLGAGSDRNCAYLGYQERPQYTNQIPISIDTTGAVYNGVGYQTSSRVSSSGTIKAITTGTTPAFVTGLIPVATNDVIRFKNCWIDPDGTADVYGGAATGLNLGRYDGSTKAYKDAFAWSTIVSGNAAIGSIVSDNNGNVVQFTYTGSVPVYIQFTLGGTAETAILTINEEIPN